MKNHSPRLRSHFLAAPAFTLVEMLVVITIITVMLSIGALGLRNLSKASGVSAGLPIAEGVFAEARTIAVGKGTKTRVLLHAQMDRDDEFHRERFLRYMAVAYQELDAAGEPVLDSWIVASRGSLLPEGVYFSPELSKLNAPVLNTMNIKLPGKSDTDCYYYEFNAEGLMVDPVVAGDVVPRFVVRAGSLPPGALEPIATSEGKKNMGGFVIWRSGRTSLFRHPDQIDP